MPLTNKYFLSKGYNYLLIAAVLLLVFSLFMGDRTLDIHLHDTYYVIGYAHIFLALSIFLFLQWMIYFLLRKFRMVSLLTWMHIVLTILFLLFLVYTLTSNNRLAGFIDLSAFERTSISWKHTGIGHWAFMLFVTGQIIWIVNIVIGVLRGKRIHHSFTQRHHDNNGTNSK
jgi:cytochrome c oxidase subunit 1